VDITGPFYTMVISTSIDGEHGGNLSHNALHALVRCYVETELASAISLHKY